MRLGLKLYIEEMGQRRRAATSFFLALLMAVSTVTMMGQALISTDDDVRYQSAPRVQIGQEGTDESHWEEPTGLSADWFAKDHPLLTNPQYADPLTLEGRAGDIDLLSLQSNGITPMLEEMIGTDHDNDGIYDLEDLDDDNDGIYDLIEMFDGCYGTDPFDHDNDGLLDHVDYDDDNDGILEGPVDWNQGVDPRNVSTDRFVVAATIHPWTGDAVGAGYMVDQNPFDHDNDGIPDEDSDGSGPKSYDEDDDNDGRIDQFKWPCDFDADGTQDYFDNDDDDDGIIDVNDRHPYNASVTQTMASWHAEDTTNNLYDNQRTWSYNEYRAYSAGINFVEREAARLPDWPAFTTIVDGDLDGDGIPNFLDPDTDNDELADNLDTDDDGDGLLDMWDPDDDNDGVVDTDDIDYDQDLDNDRWRAFDQNYNGVWDWLDADMGGNPQGTADNPEGAPSWNASDYAWDTDNDGISNEEDAFPMTPNSVVNTWNCNDPDPSNHDSRCLTERASHAGYNDWDGDGIHNWNDVDDDNDGIPDAIDIDPDCDLDNDEDMHILNGSRFRDDGPNDVDSDIDGDGLENDVDWDDDNDGINDLFDPDDGNCGILDYDNVDQYQPPLFPLPDGSPIDGSQDGGRYASNSSDMWDLVFWTNPFDSIILDYNGFDGTTVPVTSGVVPEFYWFFYARWSSWNGGNERDWDIDGDSYVNGLDVDQDSDGLPDWWDQDEANDGILDVDSPYMGGSYNNSVCSMTSEIGYTCVGYLSAFYLGMPLFNTNAQFGLPYSIRPDPTFSQGAAVGCTENCYIYPNPADGNPYNYSTYSDMENNRDLMLTWIGLSVTQDWNWFDVNYNEFPDELGDLIKDDVDSDDDCASPMLLDPANNTWFVPPCMFNDTADLDDDMDYIYDYVDVDDNNNGIWDFHEIDSDDDWDDDEGTEPPGNFFIGNNSVDNDDDGTDTDPDGDGWYQAVWDHGVMGQGMFPPLYYDVDNDNDGVPDTEDPDDNNNGILDVVEENIDWRFTGEEQSPWDHDNDGIPDWSPSAYVTGDWDGDGISNSDEIAADGGIYPFPLSPWDHDNDGLRDDRDDDDDADGMHDEDEIMLWPERFQRFSTNPWDHDDYGFGEGIANPNDPHTGPDGIDIDDDNDTIDDTDFDVLEEGNFITCGNSSVLSSDWDHNNDCILDEDDKIPTIISMANPGTLWLDSQSPALFHGHVEWRSITNGTFVPAPNLPVQVHIMWTQNQTVAVKSIDVLTNQNGDFVVGQFLHPEMLHVGPNGTYEVWAEVTEMFIHDSSESLHYQVGVEANLTIDFAAWTYFRSDEQPLWFDFKVHYEADWDRNMFENRIIHSPITFNISGGPFGSRNEPTTFPEGQGNHFRADSNGWCSLTYIQTNGSEGIWKQVRWNTSLDSGRGGYEEIQWHSGMKEHFVVQLYEYTNTSLPIGDYEVTGRVDPNLTSDDPWPYLHGAESQPFYIRSMHRMYIDAEMILEGNNAVYWWDNTQFTGDTFGAWRALFHESALALAGIDYETARAGKPHPMLWDGNPDSLTGEAEKLKPFLAANSTHWFIQMQNAGDFNSPPCGPIDPSDPQSSVRCEIIPEMDTGDTYRVRGWVANRTMVPWFTDAIALQVDLDHNGVFAGSQETGYVRHPRDVEGNAVFDYNWTWYSQYQAGTYGVRVDFTRSEYYFTGNLTSTLAATGAYVNVTVLGTTSFQLNSEPRLYRDTVTPLEARLVDNALQPVRGMPVEWLWTGNGTEGEVYTDQNGKFTIEMAIEFDDPLGRYEMEMHFPGNDLLHGHLDEQEIWVASRTFINPVSSSPIVRSSGDKWEFTAQVTDDNRTPNDRDTGNALDGNASPDGGFIDVIFEGTSFDGMRHRQVVSRIAPNAGLINAEYMLNPANIKEDPASYLPDGFGPVNVILRFEENLPNEGCAPLDENNLQLQGQWDACADVPGSDHYRRVMQHSVNGFSLIGHTTLELDDQVVYTSETDPVTGEVIEKPMVITGQLNDELGANLTNRLIRVVYELGGTSSGPTHCPDGYTDDEGRYSITCPLHGALAGKARVTVSYNAWAEENNDRHRYHNKSIIKEFPVFSNSTLALSEIGPFKTNVDRYYYEDGTSIPVLYLKESFHVIARLAQSNDRPEAPRPLGGKCLNVYLDPEENVLPLATAMTSDEDGTINWFSGDPLQNPGRKGIEPTPTQLEGVRLIRVAYEPKRDVPGGCEREPGAVVNGSHADLTVLVRSRVDLQLKETWERIQSKGYLPGEPVQGIVKVLRDRLDLAVEGEPLWFISEYRENGTWHMYNKTIAITNEQGDAMLEWAIPANKTCGGPCEWRMVAFFPGSEYFVESEYSITASIPIRSANSGLEGQSILNTDLIFVLTSILLALAIAGALWYRNYLERKRVEILRGIITDTMWALQAANEYIAVIFSCYRDLVKFFRRHGFLKKVYETTREFEEAVRKAFHMVPEQHLDGFLAIFEEARYSNHDIGATHRDTALSTLQAVMDAIDASLGTEGLVSRSEEHSSTIHDQNIKAGTFVAADGSVIMQGKDDTA